jgi:hypothetical protein
LNNFFRLLLLTAFVAMQPSVAMQLGVSKGTAVFGRPLDLSIPVRFNAPVEDPFNCFSADVFQADAKFDASRVRIDVTPAANGLDAMVRIRSNTAIVEPWAKVILRNNCGSKVSRQYDFLTDFIGDIPAIGQQTEAVAVNNLPTTSNAANASSKLNSQSATASSTLPLIPASPVSNLSVKRAQTANQTALEASTKPKLINKPSAVEPKSAAIAAVPVNVLGKVAELGQSRLKMENFALTDEHQVLLKLSTALIEPSGMRSPEELQALAQATAVWRAINGMPAASQVAATPGIAKVVAVTQPKPTDFAKDKKYDFNNPIVYGLVGLLSLALVSLAWLWLKLRKASLTAYSWLAEKEFAEPYGNDDYAPISQNNPIKDAPYVKQNNAEEMQDLAESELHRQDPLLAQETEQADETISASPIAMLKAMQVKASRDSHQSSKIKDGAVETSEFSAANASERSPEHFDDSRFDKKQLITKVNTSLVQADVMNALKESVDIVVSASIPAAPKLRAVQAPVEAVESETEINQTISPPEQQTAELAQFSTNVPKKELPRVTLQDLHKDLHKDLPKDQNAAPKTNMIDFDIFAETVPTPKPTRLSR